MGSATRETLATAVVVLDAQGAKSSLEAGEQLLAASLVVAGSNPLRAALADDTAEDARRTAVVDAVFAAYLPAARAVLQSLAVGRWSDPYDLVSALEELGIRMIAQSAPKTVSIESELFAFGDAVSSDAELELALGSKLAGAAAKTALVHRLLEGTASTQTIAILDALISAPRGRRFTEMLRFAVRLVAEQAGQVVATVTVATPLGTAQRGTLEKALSTQYGRPVAVHEIVEPEVLGGMRVQIQNDVIDGTIAGKLAELRLSLAG